MADSNGSSGDVSCMKCGRVQVENQIVSEVQFGETSSGAAMVQGSMVSSDQVRANFGGNSLESKEQTLKNGKEKIRKIGSAMGIKPYITSMAGEWFRLALLNNFVQGRRSQNVLAACLYVACRKERTHHMLIDFSSLLQISVYSLGASFLKMVKVLEITNLPLADPSIFIQHFAEKLEFGNQVTKVVRDATRLAQRMANDWIHEGRRPAGIAGACVLLAARMNNFRRLHAEIVEVAHVAEETLQKRLNEFKNTNSAKLTVQQLRDGEQVESIKPPSYLKNRTLELKIKEKYALNQSKLDSLDEDIKTKFSGTNLPEDQRRALKGDRKDMADRKDFMNSVLKGCELTEKEIQEFCKRALKRQSEYIANSLYENPYERSSSSPAIADSELSEEDKRVAINKPKNLVKYLPKTADLLEKVSSEKDNFDDLSDEELDAFLLNDEEIELKERVWTGLNQDFLIAQEKKRLKMEADELTGNTSGSTKKRRKRNNNGNGAGELAEGLNGELADQIGINSALNDIGIDETSGEALTTFDSAKRMLSKKSFTKKINYAALGGLFLDPASKA